MARQNTSICRPDPIFGTPFWSLWLEWMNGGLPCGSMVPSWRRLGIEHGVWQKRKQQQRPKQSNIWGERKALTELWSCRPGPSYTWPHFNLHISLQVGLTSPSNKCVSWEVGLELRSPDFWFNLFLIHTTDPTIHLQIKPSPSLLPSVLSFLPPLFDLL